MSDESIRMAAADVAAKAGRVIDLLDGKVTIPDPPPEIAQLIDLQSECSTQAHRLAHEHDFVAALRALDDADLLHAQILATGLDWVSSDGHSLLHAPWRPNGWQAQADDQREVGRWRQAGTTKARWNKKLRRFQAEAGSSEISPGEPGWQSDLTNRAFASLDELMWAAPKAVARRLHELSGALEQDKAAADG